MNPSGYPSDRTSEGDLLVLGRAELESLGLTWTEVVDVLDDAFRQKARGFVQNPPKPAVHPRPDAFINAMPAYLGGSDRVGIKWVAGFEGNRAKGMPYIYGVFLSSDAETGRPQALIDGGWITEMRTAGASGVVMRHVPDQPRCLAIVGAGVQGLRHLELLIEMRPGIERVRLFDSRAGAAERMLASAGDRKGIVAATAEEALEGADLVVTAVTMPLEPRLNATNTDLDALLLPIDYDDGLGAQAANETVLYVVDDRPQYASVSDLHLGSSATRTESWPRSLRGAPGASDWQADVPEHGDRDGRRCPRRTLLRPSA